MRSWAVNMMNWMNLDESMRNWKNLDVRRKEKRNSGESKRN